ncbi:MAG: ABC transporter ATP-binding protein [Bacteroidia bacterium]|nr:ABC transporter ATP-binding protein [Bacteroidia bacterium]
MDESQQVIKDYSGKDLIRDIVLYIRNYRLAFLTGTFLAIFASVVWLFIPWAIGEIISFASAYQPGEATASVWNLIGIIALAALGYYGGLETARYLIYNVAEKTSVDLQLKTLRHVVSLDLHWHEGQTSGKKLKRINRGGTSLNSLIRMFVDHAIDSTVGLIGVFIVFFTLSWQLNLILLVFFITHYALSARLTEGTKNQSKKVNALEDTFYSMQFEVLNSIATIKTLGLGSELARHVAEHSRRLLEELKYRIRLFRTRLAILGLHQQFFRLAIIGFSVWEVLNGHFAVGIIAQVFFYFSKIETAATKFSDMYHQYMMAQIDLMGVNQILREKPTVENSGTKDFPANWQAFQLRNLSFRYEGKPVLENINLIVRRGEKIGIAGASGEGKTTLFKIMQGLYTDYEGFIGFDDISLSEIRRAAYTQHTGVVLQETELFNFSIRDNITLGITPDEEGEKRFQEAVRIACVDEFANRHPNGLDTLVGEKGIKLSGGEKQRLGIARAIFRRPDILFLDEATSHLDNESETKIQEALHELFQGITAIVIAHRLSTLKDMDRILVIRNGQIIESGDYDTLSGKKGVFSEMLQQNEA